MINLTGINKAELLAALFNYAHDMKDAMKIAPQSVEVAQGFLFVASAELLAGKTDKTTTVKSQEVKKIMKNIQDAKTNAEYLDKDSARTILDADKTLKKVNGISIMISFRGNDIDTTIFNSLYGQWAAESIANILKDEISLDKTGKIKKPKK